MRIRLRRRTVPLEVHLRMLELKNAERDQAYQDGCETGDLNGYARGYEDGHNDARAALGRVA